MRHDWIVWRKPRCSLGRRKLESQRVIEGVARDRGETAIPHQIRVEGRVGRKRRAALVAGARAIRPDEIVVLDSDCDRLRIAECPARGMTAAAGIVVVKAARL